MEEDLTRPQPGLPVDGTLLRETLLRLKPSVDPTVRCGLHRYAEASRLLPSTPASVTRA